MNAIDWNQNHEDGYLAKNIDNGYVVAARIVSDWIPRQMDYLMVAVYHGYILFEVIFTQSPLPVFGIA